MAFNKLDTNTKIILIYTIIEYNRNKIDNEIIKNAPEKSKTII